MHTTAFLILSIGKGEMRGEEFMIGHPFRYNFESVEHLTAHVMRAFHTWLTHPWTDSALLLSLCSTPQPHFLKRATRDSPTLSLRHYICPSHALFSASPLHTTLLYSLRLESKLPDIYRWCSSSFLESSATSLGAIKQLATCGQHNG